MKSRNKMTDEQLAAMIEESFGNEPLQFEDVDTFEAASVAAKAMELIDEGILQPCDFSFSLPQFQSTYESMAICGFLGDDNDADDDLLCAEDDGIVDPEET